jgi:hypothetical protein
MSIAIGGICSDRDALGFPKGRNPALSSPVERIGTFAAFEVRRLAVVYHAALSLPEAGERQESKPVAILAMVDRGSLIAAGATEQSRNRRPAVDRTRWFDQRVGAEMEWLVELVRTDLVMIALR